MSIPKELEQVMRQRDGSVLGKKTILKSDHFPGCQNKRLSPQIDGAPKYRQAASIHVHGVAIPTIDGIQNVLDYIGAQSVGNQTHVLWINLREEPVGLQELEHWCIKATDELAGSSWEELKHIRQAVGLLVLLQKPQKSLEEITDELCPMLSIPQIYRIGTMFRDDKYGTHGLSPEVIGKMRAIMAEDSINMPNNSFLLDVDSSIPFSLEEISRSFLDISLSNVEPPPLLRQRLDFHFLLQQAAS